MAIFRKVHVSFWDDPFVETLTPEEKYFYLFLMTNPKVTECGIYELTKKKMRDWTGYNEETVEKLLKRFIDYKKVIYNEPTKEIALINKPKYINRLGKPVIDCIEAELKQVKEKSLIQQLSGNCQNDQIKNLYDTYNDTSPIRDTKRGQEEEEEEEKEKEWFVVFWKEYPKKVSKKKAESLFKKICKDEKTFQEIIAALNNQKKSEQWNKNDFQFVPHPSTWLNQERWQDEVTNIPKLTNKDEVAYV